MVENNELVTRKIRPLPIPTSQTHTLARRHTTGHLCSSQQLVICSSKREWPRQGEPPRDQAWLWWAFTAPLSTITISFYWVPIAIAQERQEQKRRGGEKEKGKPKFDGTKRESFSSSLAPALTVCGCKQLEATTWHWQWRLPWWLWVLMKRAAVAAALGGRKATAVSTSWIARQFESWRGKWVDFGNKSCKVLTISFLTWAIVVWIWARQLQFKAAIFNIPKNIQDSKK